MPKSVDKRDRGRAYTPEDLERKYEFVEIKKLAMENKRRIDELEKLLESLVNK